MSVFVCSLTPPKGLTEFDQPLTGKPKKPLTIPSENPTYYRILLISNSPRPFKLKQFRGVMMRSVTKVIRTLVSNIIENHYNLLVGQQLVKNNSMKGGI